MRTSGSCSLIVSSTPGDFNLRVMTIVLYRSSEPDKTTPSKSRLDSSVSDSNDVQGEPTTFEFEPLAHPGSEALI